MAIDHNFGNMDEFLSAAHKRRYPRGSKIIYADEESDSIYYLTQVSVTVLIEDDNGRKIIVVYLSEGDFFWRNRFVWRGQTHRVDQSKNRMQGRGTQLREVR